MKLFPLSSWFFLHPYYRAASSLQSKGIVRRVEARMLVTEMHLCKHGAYDSVIGETLQLIFQKKQLVGGKH